MNQINISYFQTNFGELILGSYNNKLCLCDWHYRKMRDAVDNRIKSGLNAEYFIFEDDVIKYAKNELAEYFSCKRFQLDIPLLFVGSEFQIKVWNELKTIKYGETVTYLELSKSIRNPKAIRAVANANGANSLSIFVPCHRVIGSNGELVGYAGGLETKRKLLSLENSHKQNKLF